MKDVIGIAVGRAFVDLKVADDRICDHILSGKTFEPHSLTEWARMCERGGTVIDVGGYSGLFSIAAAKHGCRVICFEPMPKNAARILENCRLNGVTIELYRMVASDMNGETHLTYNPHVQGMTSGASLVRKKGNRLTVEARTIDSFGLDPVAIKIDVERAEHLVLAGASETIARCRPELLVEVLDNDAQDRVRNAVAGYYVDCLLDVRNWLMRPC